MTRWRGLKMTSRREREQDFCEVPTGYRDRFEQPRYASGADNCAEVVCNLKGLAQAEQRSGNLLQPLRQVLQLHKCEPNSTTLRSTGDTATCLPDSSTEDEWHEANSSEDVASEEDGPANAGEDFASNEAVPANASEDFAASDKSVQANADEDLACNEEVLANAGEVVASDEGVPANAGEVAASEEEVQTTTWMLGNLPFRMTTQQLKTIVDEQFAQKYDFLHLPLSSNKMTNLGYAFINLNSAEDAALFLRVFHGRLITVRNSGKICNLKVARLQGRVMLASLLGTKNCKPVRGLVVGLKVILSRFGTPTAGSSEVA